MLETHHKCELTLRLILPNPGIVEAVFSRCWICESWRQFRCAMGHYFHTFWSQLKGVLQFENNDQVNYPSKTHKNCTIPCFLKLSQFIREQTKPYYSRLGMFTKSIIGCIMFYSLGLIPCFLKQSEICILLIETLLSCNSIFFIVFFFFL